MPFQHILFETDASGVALVTINRAEKLNALSGAVMAELREAFGVSPEKRHPGRIVTGAGEKAFVAGADIGEIGGLSPLEVRAVAQRGQASAQFRNLGKPSVAAVNGFALGGGLELAMACTVRFAAKTRGWGSPK